MRGVLQSHYNGIGTTPVGTATLAHEQTAREGEGPMFDPHSYLTHLECADCAAQLPADREQHLCPACGGVLLARYDLQAIRREVRRDRIAARPWSNGLWRYAELLP